jgi:hypothetical protein
MRCGRRIYHWSAKGLIEWRYVSETVLEEKLISAEELFFLRPEAMTAPGGPPGETATWTADAERSGQMMPEYLDAILDI